MTPKTVDRRRAQNRPAYSIGRQIKRVPGVIVAARLVRALATPLGRGRLRASLRGARFFQPATVTSEDRHPALFAFAAARLAEIAAPRILSFGCSTGEEAFTLARYVPHATIDAIDANPACIARAVRAAGHRGEHRIAFRCADTPDAVAPTDYDAVFCLSVLRHGDLEALRLESAAGLFPFARFAAAIEALDRRVKPGGLLLLWGCHFRFADTATAGHYEAVTVAGARPLSGPCYGPDDRRLADAPHTGFAFVRRHERHDQGAIGE